MTKLNTIIDFIEYYSHKYGDHPYIREKVDGQWKEITQEQTREEAYRIGAALCPEDLEQGYFPVWDSGKVISFDHFGIPYQGRTLTSAQRVFWKVWIWDQDDNKSESDITWFEMGLLNVS